VPDTDIRKFFINISVLIALTFFVGSPSYAEHKDDHSKGKPPDAEVELPEVIDCDDNPAITDDGKFSVELLAVEVEENFVTFIYEICKQSPQVKDLGHWVLALDHIKPFLAEGNTLNDFVVDCGFDGEGDEECEIASNDPTTQIKGIKFEFDDEGDDDDDDGSGGSACRIVSVTFDQSALAFGLSIDIGCVLSATKTGKQDIRKDDHPNPGYAVVQGPIAISIPDDIDILFECDINADQDEYNIGDPMSITMNVNNHGVDAFVDIYVGMGCPFGIIFSISNSGSTITQGSLSDFSTLTPFVAGVDLINPFIVDNFVVFEYVWSGIEPPGEYTLFLVLVQQGAWADGINDEGDILKLTKSTFNFLGEPH